MTARIPPGRWTCESCEKTFDREKSGNRPIRFCSSPCYQEWRKKAGAKAGCFTVGNKPWNQNLKGIHLSPHSEFKPGCESNKRVPLGTVTFRQRSREGYQRAFVKVAEPNTWRERAIVIWEAHNGPLPIGYVVHHRDRNPTNDSPDNLQALSRLDHAIEHAQDRRRAQRQGNLFGETA